MPERYPASRFSLLERYNDLSAGVIVQFREKIPEGCSCKTTKYDGRFGEPKTDLNRAIFHVPVKATAVFQYDGSWYSVSHCGSDGIIRCYRNSTEGFNEEGIYTCGFDEKDLVSERTLRYDGNRLPLNEDDPQGPMALIKYKRVPYGEYFREDEYIRTRRPEYYILR